MPYGYSQRPAGMDAGQDFDDIDGAFRSEGEDGGYWTKEAVPHDNKDGIRGFHYGSCDPWKRCWCCCVCRRCWWC